MNVIRFITRSLHLTTEKTPNEELIEAYTNFISGDEDSQIKSMTNLIKNSFNSNDLSFLGFHVTMLLSCQSINARIAGFIASTVFLSESSPYTEMLPAIYRKALRTEELVLPALYSCSFLITPFVFRSIENEIFEIVNSGSDVSRKYALHIIFKTYTQDPTVLKRLLPLLRGSLFHPSLKYTACAMLCEICKNNAADVFPLVDTILSEIPVATPVIFTKLSRIIVAMIKLSKDIAPVVEKPMQQFLSRQSSPIALTDAALVLANGTFSPTIYTQLGSKLQNIVAEETSNPNIISACLYALEQLGTKFKPNPSLIALHIESNDTAIRGPAMAIKYSHSIKDSRSTVDLYKFVATTKDTFSAKELLKVSKKEGKIYVSMLLYLYDLGIPGLIDDISSAILAINDQSTREIFLNEVYETIFEPPDDKVGISIAHAISEWSNNPDDIKILIPPTLSKKSENYQSSLLTDALSFWLRLNFSIEVGVKNRIQVLAQSPYCEVRTCAIQMLDLIEANNT